MTPEMKPIPVNAAKHVGATYGYDQIVILARRVGEDPAPNGEHITTWGRSGAHCTVAAMMGNKLKDICQWPPEWRSPIPSDATDLPDDVRRLVIAARTIAFNDWDGDSEEWTTARKELDDASEAFASRVPWDDTPEEAAA